jgi:hypothetical protein
MAGKRAEAILIANFMEDEASVGYMKFEAQGEKVKISYHNDSYPGMFDYMSSVVSIGQGREIYKSSLAYGGEYGSDQWVDGWHKPMVAAAA